MCVISANQPSFSSLWFLTLCKQNSLLNSSVAAAAAESLQSCRTSVQPHRRQPTKLPHPWDSPGKSTGVGCHCLLQFFLLILPLCSLTQLCLTLWGPKACSLPGSSIHGIFQARTLKWVAISFSRRSPPPRDQTCISCIGKQILYHWATWEAQSLA